jgi:hypothetical protein
MMILALNLLSVIVNDFHFRRTQSGPSEAYSELIIDPDAVLAGTITLQCLKPISWWRLQKIKGLGGIQLNELPHRDIGDRLESPALSTFKERLRLGAAKATNH